MEKKKKYSLFFEALRVNMFVVFTAAFIWALIQAFDQFNPIDQLFNDFDYTDLYFSNFISKEMPPDTNIYIVNIGGYPLGRLDIARQINVLQKFEPKVIGIDAVFAERKGFEDFALKTALNQKPNIVLGVFGTYDGDNLVGYTRSNPFFGEFPFGHLEFQAYPKTTRDFEKYIIAYDTTVNATVPDIVGEYAARLQSSVYIPSENDTITDAEEVVIPKESSYVFPDTANLTQMLFVQSMMYKPKKGFKEVRINAFTTEIMRLYNQEKYQKYIDRNMREEIIYYHGGSQPFIIFEAEEIVDTNENLSLIKDKIVLLGYVKQNMYSPGDTVDSHFTPLKRSPDGHADAKGIEIHAHILSMILSENYINHLPGWTNYIWAFLITQAFLMFFCYLYVYKTNYFDVISKPVQFVGIIVVLWLTFIIFDSFMFKIDMVPAVVSLLLSIEVLYLYQESLEILRIRSYLTQHINFENDESKITIARRKISGFFRTLSERRKPDGPK